MDTVPTQTVITHALLCCIGVYTPSQPYGRYMIYTQYVQQSTALVVTL